MVALAYHHETETRVSRYKKTKRAKLLQILLLTGIAVIISVLALKLPSDTSQDNVQAAHKAVQELYLDDAQVYLRPEVTQEKISATIDEVESLVIAPEDKAYQKVMQAKAKYKAVEALEGIYETEVLITPDAEAEDLLVLREDITAETIQSLIEQHQQVDIGDDKMSQEIKQYFTKAGEIITKVGDATNLIDEVPTTIQKDEDLPHVIEQIKAIETLLDEIKAQPQAEVLETTFADQVTGLSDEIIKYHEKKAIDETVLEAIFNCQSLADELSGSPLDQRKLVALTFDDGPNPDITPQVLAVLDKYDVKGTFFVLGSEVAAYPEIAKQIVDEGHIIGNHSYNHPRFSELSDEEVLIEIEQTQAAIYDATNVLPTLYRMPYGDGGARVVNLLPDLTSIIWNIDSEDWVSRDAYVIYLDVMEDLLQHSLLLMHDKDQATVDALELIIPELLEQDYHFVSPGEIGMTDLYYY